MNTFINITKNLPFEVQLKVFKNALSQFPPHKLFLDFGHCDNPALSEGFFDDISIVGNKLWFGNVESLCFDVYHSNFIPVFTRLLQDGDISINKVFFVETDDYIDMRILESLMYYAKEIHCSHDMVIIHMLRIDPNLLNKITYWKITPKIYADYNNVKLACLKYFDGLKYLEIGSVYHANVFTDIVLLVEALLTRRFYQLSFSSDLFYRDRQIHLLLPIGEDYQVGYFSYLYMKFAEKYFKVIPFVAYEKHFNSERAVFQELDAISKTDLSRYKTFMFYVERRIINQPDLRCILEMKNLENLVLEVNFIINKQLFGNLKKLTNLKTLVLNICNVPLSWLNKYIPPTLETFAINMDSISYDEDLFVLPNIFRFIALTKQIKELHLCKLGFQTTRVSGIEIVVFDNDINNTCYDIYMDNNPIRTFDIQCIRQNESKTQKICENINIHLEHDYCGALFLSSKSNVSLIQEDVDVNYKHKCH